MRENRRSGLRPRCWLALSLSLFGCPAPVDPSDAGQQDGAAGEARIRVALEVSEEGRPDGWELDSAFVRLAMVTVDSDRGGALEPMLVDLGRVRIDEDPPVEEVEAVPATYGGVTLVSGSGPGETFELAYRVGDERVEVLSARPFALMLRCSAGGVGLRPGGDAEIKAALDVAAIADVLAEAALPPPSDEVIRVDAASAPDLLGQTEAAFERGWLTTCDGED